MRATLVAAVLSYSTVISAYCPNDGDICYDVKVPQSSASAGSGNIYFQIQAPTTYSWVGFGSGDAMAGSYMYIMYQDGTGNVTISPRLGTNHQMPSEDTSSTAAKLTLLAGSGVDGNTMRANVMCSNCQSWNGGTLDLTSSSTSWIGAWKSGRSLATTSKGASITRHDQTAMFSFDLSTATVPTDSNPYVTASEGGTGEGTGTGSGSGSGGSGGTGSGSSTGSTGTSGTGAVSQSSSVQETARLTSAHGVVMSVVFVILYPIGSIIMPLLGSWVIHAVFQFVTFLLMWVGFALGIVVSQKTGYYFKPTHTLLGTVITALMIVQPITGWLHHAYYVKHAKRGIVSYAHIAYGRALMLLGVINGGLGLQLAEAPNNLVIAYAVVAAIIGVAYAAIKIFTSMRKRRAGGGGGAAAAGGRRGFGGRGDKYTPAADEMEMSGRSNGGRRTGPRH